LLHIVVHRGVESVVVTGLKELIEFLFGGLAGADVLPGFFRVLRSLGFVCFLFGSRCYRRRPGIFRRFGVRRRAYGVLIVRLVVGTSRVLDRCRASVIRRAGGRDITQLAVLRTLDGVRRLPFRRI
jgi:hypothetical protein